MPLNSILVYGFWVYAVVTAAWLMWWMTFGAYAAWMQYETELELTQAWTEYFEEHVASKWIFYDGIGG
jgi:hypothetical protein